MTQNINRVDHVAWVCEPQNQEKYVRQLTELTGHAFDGPMDRVEPGIRIFLSWEAGLEVISPLEGDAPFAIKLRDHLARRGEGPFSIVFGVRNIEKAKQKAIDLGYQPSDLITNKGNEPWIHKTKEMKEIIVGEVINSLFLFGEIVYADGVIGAEVRD